MFEYSTLIFSTSMGRREPNPGFLESTQLVQAIYTIYMHMGEYGSLKTHIENLKKYYIWQMFEYLKSDFLNKYGSHEAKRMVFGIYVDLTSGIHL